MRTAGGRYAHGPLLAQSGNADFNFTAGPNLNYAITTSNAVSERKAGKEIAHWPLRSAAIVAWWRYPVVTKDNEILELRAGGETRKLSFPAKDLICIYPGRSGAFYVVYSTEFHWRIARYSPSGVTLSGWKDGDATVATSSNRDLYIVVGGPEMIPTVWASYGRQSLYRYNYKSGSLSKDMFFPPLADVSIDSTWVSNNHLVSVLYHHHPKKQMQSLLPYRSELYSLGKNPTKVASFKSSWFVSAIDSKGKTVLALLNNRQNFGYSMASLSLRNESANVIDDDVDQIDVSTAPRYKFLVED